MRQGTELVHNLPFKVAEGTGGAEEGKYAGAIGDAALLLSRIYGGDTWACKILTGYLAQCSC